ncbi:MAG: signal peptide peptidase SppA [Terriglobia bacterium]
MSKKSSWMVGIILAAVFLLIASLLFGFYRALRSGKAGITEKSVLELNCNGEIPELPPLSPLAQIFQRDTVSLYEMGRLLRVAAHDPHIVAIRLSVHTLGYSWAQLEEVRDYLKEFRTSNKKIVANLSGDMPQEKELYLASLADEIYLNPDAALLVNGLNIDALFYKGTMEKLHIEPQMIMLKEYKNPEIFTRDKFTPEFRRMYEEILKDVQDRFVRTVSDDRKISEAKLRDVMNLGMTPAPVALKEGLVTTLGYEDEIEKKLLAEVLAGSKEYRGISASKYLNAVRSRIDRKARHRVALIGGLGQIVSGEGEEVWGEVMGGETMVTRLQEIRKEKDIEGVLFRVDSPGGSAVGSDKVWREIRLLEKSGKKVVVSMSGVAGSGGYYIAMGASKIVAQPSTITGSIGVLFAKFNVRGLLEYWLGAKMDQIKLAENADLFSPFHSLSDGQKAQVRSWMEDIYNNFVHKAAEGRGMSFEDLEPKAHGRVYTGAQAREIHLVDEVGGFDTALSLLKKELKIPEKEDVELVLYPKPKSLWRSLVEGDLLTTPLSQSRVSIEAELQKIQQELAAPAPALLLPEVDIR